MPHETKIQLSRPLLYGNDTLTEVTLREPTGKDLVDCGYPLKLGEHATEVDAANMSRLIGVCGKLGAVHMQTLPACDWQALCLAMMGFFAPRASQAESSGGTSS